MREFSLWIFALGWRLVRALPERAAYLLFSLIAQIAWLRQGRGVRQLEANLRAGRARRVADRAQVADAARACTRTCATGATRSGCRDWTPGADPRRPAGSRTTSGCGPRSREGRGVVMALSHSGNWDHAGAWSTLALAPGHDRDGAAAARGALRAVPALPPAPRAWRSCR